MRPRWLDFVSLPCPHPLGEQAVQLRCSSCAQTVQLRCIDQHRRATTQAVDQRKRAPARRKTTHSS